MKHKTPRLPVLGPNPTRCRSTVDPEAVERNLDCQRYDDCLDIAEDWPNFHCQNCTAYVPQTAAQRYRDHIGHLEFLAETQLLAELDDDDAPPFDDEEEARNLDEEPEIPATRSRIVAPGRDVCAARINRRRR
jgi:hypothetical protein